MKEDAKQSKAQKENSWFKRPRVYLYWDKDFFLSLKNMQPHLKRMATHKILDDFKSDFKGTVLKMVKIAWDSLIKIGPNEEIILTIEGLECAVFLCDKTEIPKRCLGEEPGYTSVEFVIGGEIYNEEQFRRITSVQYKWIHLASFSLKDNFGKYKTPTAEELISLIQDGFESQSMRLNAATSICFAPPKNTGIDTLRH